MSVVMHKACSYCWVAMSILLLTAGGCRKKPADYNAHDPAALARLVARVGDLDDVNAPLPLVTLSEFFEGNDDWGSIGYNLPEPQSPQEWYRVLQKIAKRPDVHDVRIEVVQQEEADSWPSTDTIWVITTAKPEDVCTWLPKRMAPDEVVGGFDRTVSRVEAYEIPAGYRAVGLWYD